MLNKSEITWFVIRRGLERRFACFCRGTRGGGDSVYTSHEVRSHPRRFIIPRSLAGYLPHGSARLVSSRPDSRVSTAISHVPRASSIPNKTRIKGGERGADGERVRKGRRKNRGGTFLSVVARPPLREVLCVRARTSDHANPTTRWILMGDRCVGKYMKIPTNLTSFCRNFLQNEVNTLEREYYTERQLQLPSSWRN